MFITVCDVRLHVVVKGEGKPIVLLHGWGQNHYMMKFLQDYFCDSYKVINLDLPGFHESSEPPSIWSIKDYAICIQEVLTALHIVDAPIFIAHSFGARIAMRYALKYPVNRLILTGAAGIRKNRGWTYYVRVYTYKLLKRLHIATTMGSEDYQSASERMRGVLIASVEDDIKYELQHIACPSLLVWGEKDKETPLWMGKMMEQKMPNATLVILPNEDHFAYFHKSIQFKRIVEAYIHE